MDIKELNDFTKFDKFSSPFKKDNNFKNTTELSQEFPTGKWILTEKIDGTNIRIILTKLDEDGKREIHLGSRKLILNEKDKGSKQYMDCLKEVNLHKIREYFEDVNSTIIIYGEGYGAKIQKGGGNYIPDGVSFVLFDVRVNDVYLERENVEDIAEKLGLDVVPIIGQGTLNDSIELVKKGFDSKWGKFLAEGIVARPKVELITRRGDRIITKVKHKDFV